MRSYRVQLQAMVAGTAAVAFTTDDVIRADDARQAERDAIELWGSKKPGTTFAPFLTVQVPGNSAQGITLADLLAFSQAEGLEPATVELAVVAGGEVVPAAIRPGARGTLDRTFVITSADDPEL